MASENGAIGVMVYNDPADFAPVSDTYPHSKYLPCTGVQRGAFRMGIGDPETHGYPSIGLNDSTLPFYLILVFKTQQMRYSSQSTFKLDRTLLKTTPNFL